MSLPSSPSALQSTTTTIAASQVVLSKVALYPDTEPRWVAGQQRHDVKPSVLMKWADDAAYVAAMRYSQAHQVTTAVVSDFQFLEATQFNDQLRCTAAVTASGARSMLVEVVLEALSPPYTEEQARPAAQGDFLYVVLKPNRRAVHGETGVPPSLQEALLQEGFLPLLVPQEPHDSEEVTRLSNAAQRLRQLKVRRSQSI